MALPMNLILPALGAAVCIGIWVNLDSTAHLAGSIWMAIGVIYLAVLTRGFTKKPKSMEIPT